MAGGGRTQVLRIIAGRWRGRKLRFPDVESLRPTPDRIRETVFNWLMHDIESARCLDLCCGSGAMGLEALSRGAGFVMFVDRNDRACHAVRQTLTQLQADNAKVVQRDVLPFLSASPDAPYDLVFFDPPYASNLLKPGCDLLEDNGWLKPGAKVYVEAPAGQKLELPDSWTVLRGKESGQVGYHLAQRPG